MDLLIRKCFDDADVMMDDDIGRHFDCFYHQNKYFDYCVVDSSVYFVDPIATPYPMMHPLTFDSGNRYAAAVVEAAIVGAVVAVAVAVIVVGAVAGVAAVGVAVEIVVAAVVDVAAVAVVVFAYLNLVEHLFVLTNRN